MVAGSGHWWANLPVARMAASDSACEVLEVGRNAWDRRLPQMSLFVHCRSYFCNIHHWLEGV